LTIGREEASFLRREVRQTVISFANTIMIIFAWQSELGELWYTSVIGKTQIVL
jgi:hypothetical protein